MSIKKLSKVVRIVQTLLFMLQQESNNCTYITAPPIPYPIGAIYQKSWCIITEPKNPKIHNIPHTSKATFNSLCLCSFPIANDEQINANPINSPQPKYSTAIIAEGH